MKKFAKIIEVNGVQVVVMRRSDNEHNEHIHLVIQKEGFSAEPILGYGDDDGLADEIFEGFGEEDAANILKSLNSLI